MEKTFDLDLVIGANWHLTSGSYYLNIAGYQGKVNQIGGSRGRWEWFATHTRGFSLSTQPAFDHGTADTMIEAKRLAQQAIQDHNANLRQLHCN